jgi:hypothetical protein
MTEESIEAKGTCFVIMGFGKKPDFETGRTLDLDKTYKNIIKPAVTAAGLNCVRADEIVHSGLIDVPMYEQLLNADVVVADLSTSTGPQGRSCSHPLEKSRSSPVTRRPECFSMWGNGVMGGSDSGDRKVSDS